MGRYALHACCGELRLELGNMHGNMPYKPSPPPSSLQVGHMRNKMPSMFGAGKAQTKLLESMPEIFSQVWGCVEV